MTLALVLPLVAVQESRAQQARRSGANSLARATAAPVSAASREELALRAHANGARKAFGPTNPESMRALWDLTAYYLRVNKFTEAERALRYLNDAVSKNPAGAPVSAGEIQQAYARAVNGMRSGAAARAGSVAGAGAGAGASVNSSHAVSGAQGPATFSQTTASSSAAASVRSGNNSRVSYTLPPLSWKLDATSAEQFECGAVSNAPGSFYVRAKVFPATGFGNLAQTVDPQIFLGKRIKLSANVRTEDVSKAQLWLRLDDKKPGVMTADNMINRPIVGTSDWNRYECILDVPKSTSLISAGIILTKSGSAWIKDAYIEEVGMNVQTTETQNTAN